MIGDVPIYGDLILAPMAGYSDVPFRMVCRQMGSAMSYVPFVADETILHKPTRAGTPIDFAPEERPVAVQIVGKDQGLLVSAAQRLLPLGPDAIDLNMGCPARRVSSRGRGAGLLRDEDQAERLARGLVAAVPIPVTAKIRLGWDDETRNYLDIARRLEDSGIAAIAVHGRTRSQGYAGVADWQAIAEVKEAVKIPVLANGDVRTVADIAEIKTITNCDGILVGRGAIGNPWIFARRDLAEVSYAERIAMIGRHLGLMIDYYGNRRGVILFRKHVVKYVQELQDASTLRPHLVSRETAEELLGLLESWSPRFERTEDQVLVAVDAVACAAPSGGSCSC